VNYQSWAGFDDPKLGYGSMLQGFKDSLPKSVTLDRHASVSVHMQVPYACKGWFAGQHRVLFSMWETDTLPANFRRWMGQFDQVIVPCEHNVELFSEFHNDVSYCPLGVNHKFWYPMDTTNNGVFRFQGGGSLWHRKGMDVLVKAFNALKLPDAELHIKAAPHAQDVPSRNLGDKVFLDRTWMSPIEQRDWYNKADCFVAPTRGEGFGLMPLQAIASGIPTIVSDSTGQAQFAHLAFGVVPCGKSKAETTGLWDEPNQKILEELMMEAYRNRDSIKQTAVARVPETKIFSWTNATRKLLSLIPEGTLLDNPEWASPDVKVEIQVVRKVKADIGTEFYNLQPGQTYVVSENVHQVLLDSGAVV
jgi:glycosyltransferase involved in cell wall biosynthesis